MGKVKNSITSCLIFVLKLYRAAISPFMVRHCRFYPSCSNYAIEAIQRFGCFKGGVLALKRILHCHPWHEGGVDLVPTKKSRV